MPRPPRRRARRRRSRNTAFLNIPYDPKYRNLYLAFIAGLCGFGLIPRATLEIPGGERRLNRIIALIRGCRYSFHDLCRVQLDTTPPRTPRFNMPFELGLVVAWTHATRQRHDWFVFEAEKHRLKKSLSDLDGTDPYLHTESAEHLLRSLANALIRSKHRPTMAQLESIYHDLRKAARVLKRDLRTDTLFEARAFRDLVVAARLGAGNRIPSLRQE